MNVVAVLMGVAALVFLVNKVYRTPGDVVFTESDKTFEGELTVAEGALPVLTPGDQVVFQESAHAGEVFVKAKSNSGVYQTIGTLNNVELYKKVQQKRARGKVASAEGNTVVVSYSFS